MKLEEFNIPLAFWTCQCCYTLMHKANPKCVGPCVRNKNGKIIVAQEMGLEEGGIL
jgi:hypothetical protein